MCIKEPLKVQETPMGFNVPEYGKFSNMVSYSTLQLTCKKLPLVNLVQYQRISAIFWKVIKILLPFSTTYLCKASFSLYTLSKIIYHNRLNEEADMRVQLSSIKPDVRNVQKCKVVPLFPYIILFEKIQSFFTKICYINI